MKHLGSLESTQEARVALGYASSNSYTSFMLSKFLRASYLDERMLTYELIVNCSVTSIERAYNISLACEPFNSQDLISNSPYYLPHSSCDVSLENLVLDHLIIP